ncbi:MAG: hypothetical protein IPJ03_02070 [Ignavibacteriales bacterium]|nr:hypothetical protein [Ignavibacteriales bacterium]
MARALDTPPHPCDLSLFTPYLSPLQNVRIRLCVAPVSLLSAEAGNLTHASSGILS